MNDVMNKLLKVASELDNAGEFELANELDDLIFEMSKDAGILWTGESSDDKNGSDDEAEEVDSDVEKALDILCERISEKELCDLPKAVWLEALELCIDSCEDMKKEAQSNFRPPLIEEYHDKRFEKLKDFPRYSSYGSYPLFYVSSGFEVFCAECAREAKDDEMFMQDANWENQTLHCDICSTKIESAYGEEDS